MFPSSADATRVEDYQTSTLTLLQQSIVHFTSNFAIHNHQKRHTMQQRRAFNSTRTFNTTRLNATKATSILTGFGWPDGPVRETGPTTVALPPGPEAIQGKSPYRTNALSLRTDGNTGLRRYRANRSRHQLPTENNQPYPSTAPTLSSNRLFP